MSRFRSQLNLSHRGRLPVINCIHFNSACRGGDQGAMYSFVLSLSLGFVRLQPAKLAAVVVGAFDIGGHPSYRGNVLQARGRVQRCR